MRVVWSAESIFVRCVYLSQRAIFTKYFTPFWHCNILISLQIPPTSVGNHRGPYGRDCKRVGLTCVPTSQPNTSADSACGYKTKILCECLFDLKMSVKTCKSESKMRVSAAQPWHRVNSNGCVLSGQQSFKQHILKTHMSTACVYPPPPPFKP